MALIQLKPAHATNPRRRAWWRSPRLVRHGVMLFFFLFLLRIAWHHNVKGGGPNGEPSVEAFCPFGGLESLYQFATTGGFIRRIEPSAMILFAAVILLTLVFSRGFCGWICPFGSIQEWVGMLGRKIFGKHFNPTGAWDCALKYVKYVLLAVIIGSTWHLGTLVFRPYDPFLAFFHLGQGIDEMPWAYAALAVVLMGSLYIERFFCKYACPLGAVIGIAGKLGLSKVVRDETDCKGCNVCQKKCFAHIDFLSAKTITDAECNHCLDCVVHCPKPNVLSLKGAGWSISHRVYAALLVIGLFSMVGVSKTAGYWATKPERVSFKNSKGQLDVGQIRGWMTLGDISKGYNVPLAELYQGAQLPARVAPETRLNQVARHYKIEFEPEGMRGVVKRLIEGTPAKKPQKEEHSGGDQEVKGFMTLNEAAMKTGVPKEYILKRLGVKAQVDPRAPLREWMHDHGKSIQEVRDAVAAYRAQRSGKK
jgi:polyferredoxin